MAKISDVEIPSLLLEEQGSNPATPAAGNSRLFAKADGLYLIDDAGTVTGPFAVSAGSLVYPERQDISVMPTPDVVSGTWTSTIISGATCQRNTPTPLNGDYVEWNVLLQAGTWSLDAVLTRFAAAGIAQFSVDGSNVGSAFDCYAASTTTQADHSATGIVIATTAVYPVRLTVAGKNASASAYGMALEALALKKTA